WRQTRVGHDTQSLWRRALAVAPSSVAHSNLGLVLARAGDTREAIPHYQEALGLRPTYAEAWNNLALAQAERGDAPGAARGLGGPPRPRGRRGTPGPGRRLSGAGPRAPPGASPRPCG